MCDDQADVTAGFQELFNQVRFASTHGLYYLSLFEALVIPDVSAALEASDRRTDADRYERWFDQYVGSKYLVGRDRTVGFSGRDCWLFSCSLLHQGTTEKQRTEARYTRYIFVPGTGVHANVFQSFQVGNRSPISFVQFTIPQFCAGVIDGATEWLKTAAHDEAVLRNYARFVRLYPGGYGRMEGGGVMIGGPVIT
jgi:hypothetical protein